MFVGVVRGLDCWGWLVGVEADCLGSQLHSFSLSRSLSSSHLGANVSNISSEQGRAEPSAAVSVCFFTTRVCATALDANSRRCAIQLNTSEDSNLINTSPVSALKPTGAVPGVAVCRSLSRRHGVLLECNACLGAPRCTGDI